MLRVDILAMHFRQPVIGGQQAITELLIANGANVNAEGGQYGNALQAASYQGHQAIAELLIAMGADVNAQGGQYAMHFRQQPMEVTRHFWSC